jgi:hypothetical protein
MFAPILQQTDLSGSITDTPVKFLALQHQPIISWLDDAAFGRDGASSVDVVTCHHTHTDASVLAPPDGLRHLKTDNTESQHGQKQQLSLYLSIKNK